jgi:hypothetical protein
VAFDEAELDTIHALRHGQILVGTRSDETAVVLGIHNDRIRILGEVIPEGDRVVVDEDRLLFLDTTAKQAHEQLGLDERFAEVFGAFPRPWPG